MADASQHYKTLGLPPGATPVQVKQAHRVLVKQWHPDLAGAHPERQLQAQEKMKEINAAYDFLKLYRPSAPPARRDDAPGRAETPTRGLGAEEIDLQTRSLERLYLEAEEQRRRLRNHLCCGCGQPLTRMDRLRQRRFHARCGPDR